MTAQLRWGLIGASSWASEWMCGAFRAVHGGTVASVFSSSSERGRRFADDNTIPRACASLDELLADDTVDAVYVSTTNELHAAHVVAAADAGKHVLCEKPLATTVADAVRMRDACDAAGVVLAVNHHLRCQDTLRTMRRLVEDGVIGEVLAARCANTGSLVEQRRTWRVNRPETGAGVVLDLTVHDVDTMRYLLADDVVAVTAMTATQGVAEPPIEDGVMGTLRTARGTLVSFHDAFTLPAARTSIEVHGTCGSLIAVDVFGPTPSGEVWLVSGGEPERVEVPERRNPYIRGVEHFAAAAAGDGLPAATADDGIASLAVALAALESARTGRIITPAAG